MATLGSVMVKFGADISDFQRGFKTVSSGMKDMERKGKSLSESFKGIGVAATAAGAGIALGLGSAISKAAEFEQGLANISAVAPELGSRMSEVKELALKMGADTKYSATKAAEGIEELVKAGVSAEAIMSGGLKGALDLATAGGLDLADAAEIASTALNSFKADNLTVTQSANILAGAANASATSVGELKFGLSAVSAVASGVGMSFEDTTAALAVFAQNGLKGSDAGTSLKTMLMNLQPSTKAARMAMKDLGIVTAEGKNQFIDANGQFKSLGEISQILQSKMKGLTDAQRLQYMQTMFGSDAVRAANILFKEGTAGVTAMKDAMSKTTAEEVAAVKMKTLNGAIEQLKGAFDTLMISVGDRFIPVATKLAEKLQGVVEWFNKLNPTTKTTIAVIAALAGGVALLSGPLLILIGFLPQLVSGFKLVAIGARALGTAFMFLCTNPIGLVILAIAALIAIGVLLYKNWDTVKATAERVWGAISAFFQRTWSSIANYATSSFGKLKSGLDSVWSGIGKAVSNAWDGIKNTIKGAINSVIGMVNSFIRKFNGISISIPSVNIPGIGKVGGFNLGMPNIPEVPQLAVGTNYVAGDGLAFLHEGEAVVPKRYNPAAGGQSGGGDVNTYNISVVIDAKDLDEMRSIQDFFKRIPQAARSMGV